MQKCQGTYNYIFSRHNLRPIVDLGFSVNSQESSRYVSHNIWLHAEGGPFCVQFREIQNEDLFCGKVREHPIDLLMPGFLNPEEIPAPAALSPYKLKGLLLEETPLTKSILHHWKFPFEIVWGQAHETSLFHQLSYKKKFPFWCILVESFQYQGREADWVHLETASWDFLIL